MVEIAGIEPASRQFHFGFSACRNPSYPLAALERIEHPYSILEIDVLPLNERAIWSGQRDSNSQRLVPKTSALPNCAISRYLTGALYEIRTHDLGIKSPLLLPSELKGHRKSERPNPLWQKTSSGVPQLSQVVFCFRHSTIYATRWRAHYACVPALSFSKNFRIWFIHFKWQSLQKIISHFGIGLSRFVPVWFPNQKLKLITTTSSHVRSRLHVQHLYL